jgi:tol-pal system-associated acyl-CoA thioesterase
MACFVFQHRVVWPDIDLAGVVYFANFMSYFERAEVEWVRSHGIEYGEFLETLGIWMPRVSVQCNYHRPARLDDLLSTEMRLERMGRTSFTLAFNIYREPAREYLADGTFVIAAVSRTSFKPIPIPKPYREILESLGK